MITQIQTTLAEIGRRYTDRRVFVYTLGATAGDGRFHLSGDLLDQAMLTAVLQELTARFPSETFDTAGVRVLRQPEVDYRWVTTNLAGVYIAPSRTTEQMTQVGNGALLEILKSEGDYLFARQEDGYLGWVNRHYLGSERAEMGSAIMATHLICVPISLLHATPHEEAPLVTRAFSGTAVAATLHGDWAHITLTGNSIGWVHQSDLRPLESLPTTENGRRQQIMADAPGYIGVPYLWGGCTALGIDCSGYAKLLHRLVGVTIPRDADQQFFAGQPADTPFLPGDLLFFGGGYGHRNISHVAISTGGWHIIHAAGSPNGVYTADVQADTWLRDHFIGARRFV